MMSVSSAPGITEWKYGYLCFTQESDGVGERHIYLLRNRLFAFCDSVSRKGSLSDGIRLFSLPAQATKPLSVYLFVVRPVALKLLAMLGSKPLAYATRIWATVEPHPGAQPWIWTGSMVSMAVKRVTHRFLGSALTPFLITCILSSLFGGDFWELVTTPEDSPVDRQAQHTHTTSVLNYGWIVNHFPPVKYLRLHRPYAHLAVSEIWHAFLGIGGLASHWRGLTKESSPLLVRCLNKQKAIESATILISQELFLSPHNQQGAPGLPANFLPFLNFMPIASLEKVRS
jgi:hypothetical protein